MARIQVKRFSKAQTLIKISGDIDEFLEPEALARAGEEGVVVIDLNGVRRITSYGVRQWQTALRSLHASYYAFIRVRPLLVWQFNFISGFGGRGELVSLYLPYECRACGEEDSRLVDLRHEFAAVALLDLGPFRCPSCGSLDTEVNELPEDYLEYARGAARPSPPPEAERLIDGFTRPYDARFRVEKKVVGDVTGLWMSGGLSERHRLNRLSEGLQGDVVLFAADVSGITEAGASALDHLLSRPGCRFYLARIPPPLWPVARKIVVEQGTAELLSVALPFYCKGCDRSALVPVNRSGLAKVKEKAPLRCGECQAQLEPRFEAEALKEPLGLPFASVPAKIAEYVSSSDPTPRRPESERRRGPEGLFADAELNELYEVVEPLGAGGMGRLFLARKLGIGGFEKTVVIKVVRGRLATKRKYVDMFLNEARLAARLSHPNIVQIFDVGVSGEQYFSVMEYVLGADLAKLIGISKELGRLWPIELCCTIASEVCSALWAAHTCRDESGRLSPIVHRDVAPDNILLSNEGNVKLTDFGIARLADVGATSPRFRVGKAPYLPPEVVFDGAPFRDPRCDIYSVGVVLHEMLTLEEPFAEGVPRESRPLPPRLEGIVERARARKPEDRFSSARELQDELDEILKTDLGGRVRPADIGEFVGDLLEHDTGIQPRARTLETDRGSLEPVDESALEFDGEGQEAT